MPWDWQLHSPVNGRWGFGRIQSEYSCIQIPSMIIKPVGRILKCDLRNRAWVPMNAVPSASLNPIHIGRQPIHSAQTARSMGERIPFACMRQRSLRPLQMHRPVHICWHFRVYRETTSERKPLHSWPYRWLRNGAPDVSRGPLSEFFPGIFCYST